MGFWAAAIVYVWPAAHAVWLDVQSDQHTQTLVAMGTFAVVAFGGLAHVVFRLGTLTQEVKGLRDDMREVRRHLWPRDARQAAPPRSRRE